MKVSFRKLDHVDSNWESDTKNPPTSFANEPKRESQLSGSESQIGRQYLNYLVIRQMPHRTARFRVYMSSIT